MGIGLINTHFLSLAHPIGSQAWLEGMGERQTMVGSQIQKSKEDRVQGAVEGRKRGRTLAGMDGISWGN